MFFRKKTDNQEINSREYERVVKRLLELEQEIGKIKAEIDSLATSLSSLRGFVNRRMGGWEKEERESEKDLNTDAFSPFRL